MKADLEKANGALAGGRSDEASVYAWNALADIGPDDAPELARIARALDDQLLLREIERRGLSTLPAEEPDAELRHVVGGRTDRLRDLRDGDETGRSQERTNRCAPQCVPGAAPPV
jgi:hypothetical protein